MTSNSLPLRIGGEQLNDPVNRLCSEKSDDDEGGKASPEIGIYLTAWDEGREYTPSIERFHYMINATSTAAIKYLLDRLNRDPTEIWLKSQDFDTVIFSTQTKGRAPTQDEPAVPMAIVFKGMAFCDLKRALYTLKTQTDIAA